MDIHINIDNALKGLQAAQEKVHRGIELYGQTASLKMEAYAKENRPWHDHTGDARKTIKGISGWGRIDGNSGDTSQFVIGVSGGMPYSKWLELAHGKKYAILWPALNALTAETLRGFAAMMNALH